jgi:tripartite-type tricarboxylate transporter receptor subunit TctC
MAVPNVTGQLLGLYRAEKIRILAVNSPTRHPALPDVPTATEAGVPGMIAQNFFGIFAPTNTPKDVMQRFDDATQAALSDSDFQEKLVKAGFEPLSGLGGEKAKTYVKDEYARWEPIVRATGARID